MAQPDLEALEAEYERLWLEYNRLAQHLPACEHVAAWQAQVEDARKGYQAALKAIDKAATRADEAEDDDGALFPLEDVAPGRAA